MILAAGKGKRLAPLTNTVPKPLIDINGETLIERHLSALASAGFNEVVINVSHLGHMIERRVDEIALPGIHVTYSREPEEPLETGGGILRALPLFGQDPFLVVNADIWTDYAFKVSAPRKGALAHLILSPNPTHHPDGDFTLNGSSVERHLHNPLTYTGIGVYTPELFAGVSQKRFSLTPMLFDLAREGRLSGEIYDGVWFDIGTPERLDEARLAVTHRR
jgi:N-acetyl-alpha-D-muramate 1-phosphate uridylyltransferase